MEMLAVRKKRQFVMKNVCEEEKNGISLRSNLFILILR